MWLPPVCVAETSTPMVPAPLASMAPLLATVSVPETLMVSVDAGVVTSGESVPLVTVIVVALTDGAATWPLSVTVAGAIGVESVSVPSVGPASVSAPFAPRRIGSTLCNGSPCAEGSVSKRETPCQASPAATLIVSVPFGASVTVLLLTVAMRHVPFSVPVAGSAISTQWPAKEAGLLATRAVRRGAPRERRESAAEIAVLDGDGAAAGARAVGAVGVAGGLDRAGTGDLAAGDPDRSARAALAAAVGAVGADGAVDDERRGVDADDAAAVRAAVGAAAAARFLRTVDAAVRREAGDRRAAVVHESESDVAAADVGGDRGERIRRLDRISLTADVDRAAAGDEERAGLDVERVRAADVDRLLHERRAVHDQQARELVMADDRRRAAGDGDGLEVVREVAVVDGGVRGDRLLRRDDGDARLLHAGALAVRRRRGRDGDDAAVGQA